MKYHYKTPEEFREQFSRRKKNDRHPLLSKGFLFLVADVAIILIAGFFLYTSGYSELLRSGEGVIRVQYERTDESHIRLHLSTEKRDVLLVDGQTTTEKGREKNTAVLNEVRWETERGQEILILRDTPRFPPLYIEGGKPTTLDLVIPEAARSATAQTLQIELRFASRSMRPAQMAP